MHRRTKNPPLFTASGYKLPRKRLLPPTIPATPRGTAVSSSCADSTPLAGDLLTFDYQERHADGCAGTKEHIQYITKRDEFPVCVLCGTLQQGRQIESEDALVNLQDPHDRGADHRTSSGLMMGGTEEETAWNTIYEGLMRFTGGSLEGVMDAALRYKPHESSHQVSVRVSQEASKSRRGSGAGQRGMGMSSQLAGLRTIKFLLCGYPSQMDEAALLWMRFCSKLRCQRLRREEMVRENKGVQTQVEKLSEEQASRIRVKEAVGAKGRESLSAEEVFYHNVSKRPVQAKNVTGRNYRTEKAEAPAIALHVIRKHSLPFTDAKLASLVGGDVDNLRSTYKQRVIPLLQLKEPSVEKRMRGTVLSIVHDCIGPEGSFESRWAAQQCMNLIIDRGVDRGPKGPLWQGIDRPWEVASLCWSVLDCIGCVPQEGDLTQHSMPTATTPRKWSDMQSPLLKKSQGVKRKLKRKVHKSSKPRKLLHNSASTQSMQFKNRLESLVDEEEDTKSTFIEAGSFSSSEEEEEDEKGPQRVKRPRSCFFFYMDERRKQMTEDPVYQGLGTKEMVSRMSKEWNALSDKKKQPYRDAADAAKKAQKEQQLAIGNPYLSSAPKKRIKSPRRSTLRIYDTPGSSVAEPMPSPVSTSPHPSPLSRASSSGLASPITCTASRSTSTESMGHYSTRIIPMQVFETPLLKGRSVSASDKWATTCISITEAWNEREVPSDISQEQLEFSRLSQLKTRRCVRQRWMSGLALWDLSLRSLPTVSMYRTPRECVQDALRRHFVSTVVYPIENAWSVKQKKTSDVVLVALNTRTLIFMYLSGVVMGG